MEQWVKIPGASRYSVSDWANIRNDHTERILKHIRLTNGHVLVSLVFDNGEHAKKYVAHLVAEHFVPKTGRKQDDTLIHLDGDIGNCFADNLQWRPRWFASRYRMQFRTMKGYRTLPIRNKDTGEVYLDVWDLIVQQGVLLNDVRRCINENTVMWPSMDRYEWIE